MENKNTNAVLVIFIILTVCLGGYIVYDKLNTNTNENNKHLQETPNKESNNSSENSNSAEIPSKTSVVNFYFDSIAIVSDGNVYVNVYGATHEIDDLFGDGTFQTLVSTRNKYQEYSFNNFEYYKGNNNFKGMKLNATNVEKVYTYDNGQEIPDNYGLILLNKDNTLSIISLYSLINGKTTVKNIPNLSDIKSIVSEDNNGVTTYAVKQNGEKVNLEDYIPKSYKEF